MTSTARALTFGEYVVERELGAGAMGEVYLARDPVLDRRVAIKRIASRTISGAAKERFLVEARAAARIQHANVAAVYRAGEIDGSPFLVSEFVVGRTLDSFELPLAYDRVLDIAVGLARGLAAAHERGVLHRDLKPGNVILGEGDRPKLVDFGLAKLLEQGPDAEEAAPPAGGPAPEPREATIAPALRDATIAPTLRDATIAPALRDATIAPTLRDATIAPELRDATIAPDLRNATLAPAVRDTTVAPTLHDATAAPFPRARSTSTARRLTHEGAILGTPDYMAPESWRAEPASAATDLYALGALLFELCTGHTPFASIPVEALRDTVLTRDAPGLATETVGLDRRFTAIVDRCLARDADQRFDSAEALADALEHLRRDHHVGPVPDGNPYRGLAAFDARHRALFFGRERDVERVIDKLRTSSLVVVTGDSGLGKSSLVRAGVIPRLAEGIDGRTWSSARMTPGRHPLSALIDALDALVAIGADALLELVEQRPHELAAQLRRKLGSERGVVLVVDQLEEFCTQSVVDERDRVAELLARLCDDVPGVRILATLRADYLTRLAALPRLGEQLCRSIHVMSPLDEDGIREVIVGPARATGIRFESVALVDALIDATTQNRRGALPLLQFALEKLWHLRDVDAKTITQAALDSLGGVAGALARHADDVVAALPAGHRRQARSLLVMLTSDEGVKVARSVEELLFGEDDARRATLDALVAGRLVVAAELGDTTVFELAHEVLITGWPTFVRWRHEDEDVRAAQDRLNAGVKEWLRLDRATAALWSTTQLDEVAPLVDRIDRSADADAFLAASRRRVRRQRTRRIARFVLPPLFVALSIVGFYGYQRAAAERRAEAALAQGIVAGTEAEAARAEHAEHRQAAFAAFDRGEEDAEEKWSAAKGASERAEDKYREALQHVERALSHRPERDDLRASFAELLYARATLAELREAPALASELLDRLALYDDDGALLARWNAPATVVLDGLPSDGSPILERYGAEDHRFVPTAVDVVIGGTVTLAPGSYRLTVAHGGAPVRYPFVVTRGEQLVLDVGAAPPALPEGFVYVPAGRFVYGSTADDESRIGFFDAVPAHTATLPAFAIARHEVTFAQWLAYLDDLPSEERAALLGSKMNDAGLTSGGQALTRDGRGWSITMRPAKVTYRARAGEPIRYPDRARRQAQDWLQMPVTGVSADDAQPYLAWLDETKRVPGARLCTEREWERAARGADRREYPHANVLDPDAINFDQTYAKAPGGMGPDEVGAHPDSHSPFDLADMAGNAFEWTTAATSTGTYVLRGGSFFYDAKTNRLTNRAVAVSSLRVGSVGLRVCIDLEKENAS